MNRAAVLVIASLMCACSQSQQHAPLPNIVIAYVDDQGWTGTSVQMDPRRPDTRSDYFRTPSLERLAREGMTFSEAYAPAPVCSPSRASVLTGKSPAQLKITDVIQAARNGHPHHARNQGERLLPPRPLPGLPAAEITVAEYIKLHRPQYATAHFGKWHLGSGGPGKHGFDVHDGDTSGWTEYTGPDDNPKDTFGISRRAITFIGNQVKRHRPFFVQLSYHAVHRPIQFRPNTLKRFLQRPKGKNHANPEYAAMTEDLDEGFGMILSTLDELGIAGNTYVVYTSDNGAVAAIPSSPLKGSKLKLDEGGIRVPLVIRGPGIKARTYTAVPVIGWDLFPTFREWVGITSALPHGIEGGSLVPVLEGSDTVTRPRAEFIWHAPNYYSGFFGRTPPQAAIRVGDFKLVKYFESGRATLYNLRHDLAESHDLSQEFPKKKSELLNRLDRYYEAVDARLPRPNPAFKNNRHSN